METQISPNMIKSEEGYLLCKNVKVAHTKPMPYIVGGEKGDIPRIVNISNSNTILEKEFYMSLIGKPLVDNHPDEKVNSENYSEYIKGTIVNAYADNGDLVCDILVYDKETQDLIMNGKREVSMQVDATLTKLADSEYIKNPVSFNHLALVDRGRAGREYKFIDSEEIMEEKEQQISVPTSFFEKLFGKKDEKQEVDDVKKTFSDMEDALSTLKDEIAKLTEEVAGIKESMKKEEATSFEDGEDSVVAAICEFIPFRKGMDLDRGVRSALDAASLSPVGKSVETLLAGRNVSEMTFADAKNTLLGAFELKKAINTPNITQAQPTQEKKATFISGADLNQMYENNKENK